MPKYSLIDGATFGWSQEKQSEVTIKDYVHNGQHCESGLAYNSALNTATCTSTTKIMFDEKETVYPYKCDPTYPHTNCKIMFNIDPANAGYATNELSFVNTDCRCSLSSLGGGFCQDVIGTEVYKKYAKQMNHIYNMSECHTLDRDDIRSQRDSCGVGAVDEEWRFAVD